MTDWRFNAAERQRVDVTGPAEDGVGDLLIGELSGERRHGNVAVARRNPLKHDLDDVCRVRRNDDAVARKRREDADNAPAPGLLAAAAMVGVERTAALLRRV